MFYLKAVLMHLQWNWKIIDYYRVVTTIAFLRVFQNLGKLLLIKCATCFSMLDWGDSSGLRISGRILVVTVFGEGTEGYERTNYLKGRDLDPSTNATLICRYYSQVP